MSKLISAVGKQLVVNIFEKQALAVATGASILRI